MDKARINCTSCVKLVTHGTNKTVGCGTTFFLMVYPSLRVSENGGLLGKPERALWETSWFDDKCKIIAKSKDAWSKRPNILLCSSYWFGHIGKDKV